MSRRKSSELGFGSDSFLDIIANIVGILIILIVVAGVRVSQTPLAPPTASNGPPPAAAAIVVNAVQASLPAVVVSPPSERVIVAVKAERVLPPVVAPDPPMFDVPAVTLETSPTPVAVVVQEHDDYIPEPLFAPEPDPEPEPQRPLEPSPELLARIAALENAIRAAQREEKTHIGERARLKKVGKELETKLRADTARVEKAADLNRRRIEILNSLGKQLQQEDAGLEKLKVELDVEVAKKQNVVELEHKLTPVSRIVKGKEVHFRVEQNRVSHVPVEALTERMRDQVNRQKEWLVKVRRHDGEVGPVNGYSMNYTIEREELSAIDQLRNGRGMVRISLSSWRIRPQPELQAEAVDDALKLSSAFVRTLYLADPGATLTFWVYPDSFGAYRRLQKLARDEGFTVAARPLPEGEPIAASRNGSRSAGQ